MSGTNYVPDRASVVDAPAPPAHPRPWFARPTIYGPERVVIAGRLFYLPSGSRVVHADDNGGGHAYVLDREGGVHVFAAHGELIGLPAVVLAAIKRQAFP